MTDATAETDWINSAVVTEASAARIVEWAEPMSYLTVGASYGLPPNVVVALTDWAREEVVVGLIRDAYLDPGLPDACEQGGACAHKAATEPEQSLTSRHGASA